MAQQMMRTIEVSEFGDADVLELGTRPIPELGPNDVLVKTIAAGVNGPDLVQRKGHYPPPKGASDLLGLEVSGEIVELGKNVTAWSIGQTVCALTNGGGYAEYVAIDAEHCLPIPEGIDPVDAAGLPETYFTVWSNFFHKISPQKGELFLVHGGAGGIGSTAIQLGKLNGLSVLTTCSNKNSIEFCKNLGADYVVNYREEDFVSKARELGGANLILDTVGGEYIARNIKASRQGARIVQLAFNKGSKVDIDLMPIMLKRITYTGATLRSRPSAFKASIASDLRAKVWPFFKSQKLQSLTHKVFKLEDASEAHKLMERSQHHGKILLIP